MPTETRLPQEMFNMSHSSVTEHEVLVLEKPSQLSGACVDFGCTATIYQYKHTEHAQILPDLCLDMCANSSSAVKSPTELHECTEEETQRGLVTDKQLELFKK